MAIPTGYNQSLSRMGRFAIARPRRYAGAFVINSQKSSPSICGLERLFCKGGRRHPLQTYQVTCSDSTAWQLAGAPSHDPTASTVTRFQGTPAQGLRYRDRPRGRSPKQFYCGHSYRRQASIALSPGFVLLPSCSAFTTSTRPLPAYCTVSLSTPSNRCPVIRIIAPLPAACQGGLIALKFRALYRSRPCPIRVDCPRRTCSVVKDTIPGRPGAVDEIDLVVRGERGRKGSRFTSGPVDRMECPLSLLYCRRC